MQNERQVEFQSYKFNLDTTTVDGDYKDNRINQKILSLSFSDSSSPNVKLKVKFKEGDELILRPGRVVHLKEISLGAIFTWDSQPSEWAVIEISDKVYFPSSDYLSNTTFMAETEATVFKKSTKTTSWASSVKVLDNDQNRRWVKIFNLGSSLVKYGTKEEADEGYTNGMSNFGTEKIIYPRSSKIIKTNKDLWAYSSGDSVLLVTEAF